METATRNVERPLVGAGSLIEHYGQDWRVLAFLLRAQLLHDAHPTIAAAVADHSTVFSDPSTRAWRTLGYAMRLYLGPDVEQTARDLRELHRDLGGTDGDGNRYHAWQRESWTFAHLTLAESTIHAITLFHAISDEDLEEVYAAYRHVGCLYGVREDDMPDTIAGLHEWFDNAVATQTADTRLTAALAGMGSLPWPFPPPRRVPVRVARAALGHLVAVVVGILPDSQQSRFAPRRTGLHRLEWSATLMVMRAFSYLPRRFQVLPAAMRQRALGELQQRAAGAAA